MYWGAINGSLFIVIRERNEHVSYQLQPLVLLLACLKEGSVVGAARALYLTPQTITGQIRALEERLQGKLFKRKGRGLEPSELGELVYRYAD